MARISLVFTSLFSKIKTTRPEHLKFQTPLETFIFAQDRILNNYFSRAPPPICMIGQLPHHFRNVLDWNFFSTRRPTVASAPLRQSLTFRLLFTPILAKRPTGHIPVVYDRPFPNPLKRCMTNAFSRKRFSGLNGNPGNPDLWWWRVDHPTTSNNLSFINPSPRLKWNLLPRKTTLLGKFLLNL